MDVAMISRVRAILLYIERHVTLFSQSTFPNNIYIVADIFIGGDRSDIAETLLKVALNTILPSALLVENMSIREREKKQVCRIYYKRYQIKFYLASGSG